MKEQLPGKEPINLQDKVFEKYYKIWAFTHPNPNDYVRLAGDKGYTPQDIADQVINNTPRGKSMKQFHIDMSQRFNQPIYAALQRDIENNLRQPQNSPFVFDIDETARLGKRVSEDEAKKVKSAYSFGLLKNLKGVVNQVSVEKSILNSNEWVLRVGIADPEKAELLPNNLEGVKLEIINSHVIKAQAEQILNKYFKIWAFVHPRPTEPTIFMGRPYSPQDITNEVVNNTQFGTEMKQFAIDTAEKYGLSVEEGVQSMIESSLKDPEDSEPVFKRDEQNGIKKRTSQEDVDKVVAAYSKGLARLPGVLGAGSEVSSKNPQEWVLKTYVTDPNIVDLLPEHLEKVALEVEVTNPILAQ